MRAEKLSTVYHKGNVNRTYGTLSNNNKLSKLCLFTKTKLHFPLDNLYSKCTINTLLPDSPSSDPWHTSQYIVIFDVKFSRKVKKATRSERVVEGSGGV